jgi:hypothetical protein
MIYRGNETSLGQRPALGVGNRDHRHVGKHAIERPQFGQIEAAVQSGEEWYSGSPQHRIAEVIAVEVHDIEVAGALRDALEHGEQRRHAVADRRIQSKRSRAARF